MKKIVSCSGCGKKHEIVAETGNGPLYSLTFKPVPTIFDRIREAHREICIDFLNPFRLYLGRKEMGELDVECCSSAGYFSRQELLAKPPTKCYGFEVVFVDKLSHFHATGEKE